MSISSIDEFPHRPGSQVGWRESFVFDLLSSTEDLAGSIRIEADSERQSLTWTLAFHLPDGGYVASRQVVALPQAWGQGTPESLDVDRGAIVFAKPLAQTKFSFDGPCRTLRSLLDAGKSEKWEKAPLERLILDLTFNTTHPPIPTTEWRLGRTRDESLAQSTIEGPGESDAFEQPGSWRGEIWVSGDCYSIEGLGIRERSWRQHLPGTAIREQSLSVAFGPESAVRVHQAWGADGSSSVAGWVLAEGSLAEARQVESQTETRIHTFEPRLIHLVVADAFGRSHQIEAVAERVLVVRGLRNGVEVASCEALAEFRSAAGTGKGVAEYLYQLDAAGEPESLKA